MKGKLVDVVILKTQNGSSIYSLNGALFPEQVELIDDTIGSNTSRWCHMQKIGEMEVVGGPTFRRSYVDDA